MTKKEIIQLRQWNQGLSQSRFDDPEGVVSHFGAMQAQDYSMSLWAVALRMKNPGRGQVEACVNTGKLIRTHVLRPTWHLVHQQDIRWMMRLSAPSLRKATQFIDKQEGLTDDLFKCVWPVIEKQLQQNPSLSKEEIMACLSAESFRISNLLATQILIRAEIDMLICNGDKKGSYALFDTKVPPAPDVPRQESIVRLAEIYFRSRGPATLKDFSWWSGLPLKDAQMGVAELALNRISCENMTFYFNEPAGLGKQRALALLPCYDEYTVSYSEGRDLALPAHVDKQKLGNGIFKPTVLYGEAIVGTWKKNGKGTGVELARFPDQKPIPENVLDSAVSKFLDFIR
ncbi:hypothetical protein C7T94_10795 [Pedobacter yulinensis]|uniref:Winged helix DNA-binding domain-containing protein n=1 Tax=Pedobacter yulinensis TaxID=2126353 RepID=A0A2T3HKZ1_9SPHI|nr:winged helix DNA-binding domain-containing protein [Pedobacter yulinensis]PST83094.1 hypothetical protein C7T94_10795 [Pedobacter yulinensis]